MNDVACLNGRWIPLSQVSISPFDAGFVYGATLVETQRTFRQQLRFANHHLDRFYRGAELCGFGALPARQAMIETFDELVETNRMALAEGGELAVYLIATPGRSDGAEREPTWAIYSKPFDCGRYRPFFEGGADLLIPDVSPLPAAVLSNRIKHRSRLHWWLAERQVERDAVPGSAPLPLLIDEAGTVADTPIASFGIARGKVVIFPKSESILDSVGLKITKEILLGQQVKYLEDDIHFSTMLEEADEAFLSGSSIGVCPVRSVAGTALPKCPGPMARLIQEQWNLLIGYDLAGQFRG